MQTSPNIASLAAEKSVSPRRAFTLVELMVVIVIIGIIAGFALPAIFSAVKAARQGAYKLEVDTLADAVEKYRTKYGDYPPDGSSWPIMERHLRKAFPQILQSELNLLNPANFAGQGWTGNPWTADTSNDVEAGIRNDFDRSVVTPAYTASELKVMDPAEALVFFLGGFSSNPQRPFTGEGGPFSVTSTDTTVTGGQTLQYNVQRTGAFFDFKADRLSLKQIPAVVRRSSGGNLNVVANVSNDEEFFLADVNAIDLLPVYLPRADIQNEAPFVYFDARTYVQEKGGAVYAGFYQRSSPTDTTLTAATERFGAIRPLVTETRRTPYTTPTTALDVNWFRRNLFYEDKKFQVLGAGIDGIYGGRIAQDFSGVNYNDRAAAFLTFPSGRPYAINNTFHGSVAPAKIYDRLLVPKLDGSARNALYDLALGSFDNAANCLEGSTFANSLSVPGK